MIALAQVAGAPAFFNNLKKQRSRLLARSSIPQENKILAPSPACRWFHLVEG